MFSEPVRMPMPVSPDGSVPKWSPGPATTDPATVLFGITNSPVELSNVAAAPTPLLLNTCPLVPVAI